jgi:hypothetical protein
MVIAIGLSVLQTHKRGQDYLECGWLQDGIRKSTVSRPNAGEIGDALLDFAKTRLALELGAVSLCGGCSGLHVTSIGDSGIFGVPIEDKRLWRACSARAHS